jgi:hypothetical protein
MRFVLLVFHGPTPALPGSDRWQSPGQERARAPQSRSRATAGTPNAIINAERCANRAVCVIVAKCLPALQFRPAGS